MERRQISLRTLFLGGGCKDSHGGYGCGFDSFDRELESGVNKFTSASSNCSSLFASLVSKKRIFLVVVLLLVPLESTAVAISTSERCNENQAEFVRIDRNFRQHMCITVPGRLGAGNAAMHDAGRSLSHSRFRIPITVLTGTDRRSVMLQSCFFRTAQTRIICFTPGRLPPLPSLCP
jgi:hypothetical protein